MFASRSLLGKAVVRRIAAKKPAAAKQPRSNKRVKILPPINGYNLFMINKFPKTKRSLNFIQRGRIVARMWSNLPASQQAALQAKAEKMPLRRKVFPKRKPNAVAKFVKANYEKFRGLPNKQRIQAIMKLYRVEKALTQQVAKKVKAAAVKK